MTDFDSRTASTRSALRRAVAAATVSYFAAHSLSGGMALAAAPHPARRHKAAATARAMQPATAPSAVQLAAATGSAGAAASPDAAGPASVAASPDAAASADARAPTALEEVTINAQRTTDAIARLAQKQAINVINIETYNTIKQMPDATVAAALQRIPGIS
ncbi:MAG TPA: hypothetical protein VGN43_19230, partial [Steroidobacteraceae bacterium]|nr:hypothetical protein [Steroidobacteraceae bacterium]